MKRRSLTVDEVEGLEIDPNLEEPLKAKLRRESRQGFCFQFISFKTNLSLELLLSLTIGIR